MENATDVSCSNSGNFLQIASTLSWMWIPALLLIFSATCSTSLTLSFLASLHYSHRALRGIHSFTHLLGTMLNALLILSNAIFSNLNILSSFDRRGNESN